MLICWRFLHLLGCGDCYLQLETLIISVGCGPVFVFCTRLLDLYEAPQNTNDSNLASWIFR